MTELLRSGRPVDTLFLASGDDDKQAGYYKALAKESGAVIKYAHPDKLSEICSDKRHQGMVAVGAIIEYTGIPDILSTAEQRNEKPFVVMADGMEDPHNLGAIIRTAEIVGAHGVVIPKRGSVQINVTVQRASAGAVNTIDIARVSNLAGAVRDMKKKGIFCYAAEPGGISAYEVDLTGPILLIIGSEGYGVSRLLRELSDDCIALPQRGKTGSLNASVAAGVLMYEIIRQRTYRG